MSADKITPLMVEVMTHSELQDECERQRAELAALRAQLIEKTRVERGYCEEMVKAREQLAERDAELAAQQAKIDALMLEYCPDEMSDAQIENWTARQRAAYPKEADK